VATWKVACFATASAGPSLSTCRIPPPRQIPYKAPLAFQQPLERVRSSWRRLASVNAVALDPRPWGRRRGLGRALGGGAQALDGGLREVLQAVATAHSAMSTSAIAKFALLDQLPSPRV